MISEGFLYVLANLGALLACSLAEKTCTSTVFECNPKRTFQHLGSWSHFRAILMSFCVHFNVIEHLRVAISGQFWPILRSLDSDSKSSTGKTRFFGVNLSGMNFSLRQCTLPYKGGHFLGQPKCEEKNSILHSWRPCFQNFPIWKVHLRGIVIKTDYYSLSPMYPYPVTVHFLPALWLVPRAGRQTRQTPSLRSASPWSFKMAMSLSKVWELWLWWMYVVATRKVCAPGLPYFWVKSWSPTRTYMASPARTMLKNQRWHYFPWHLMDVEHVRKNEIWVMKFV